MADDQARDILSREAALNRLRIELAFIEDGRVRNAVYRAAVELAHASASETLDECRRAVRETMGFAV